jgi:hypothetical protein
MRELALTRAYARALDLPEATPQLAADSANRRAECEQGCDAAKQRASEAAKIAADARAQAITARDAAQQTLTASQQAETAFAAAEQAVKDALAAMEAQRADLAVKQALVQTLTEAAAKTAEAAATLPDDQELASALATLKNRGEATAATIATLSQTMTQCQSDMGTKESAVAAQRETLNQCRAQWESAQSQQTTAVKAWQTAMQQAAIAEGTAAAAQRNLSELKALSSYQSAQEAVEANQATQAQALERLASVIASAKSPPAADPTMATVNNDLAGAQVVLASVRTRLSEQEKLAQQLTEAVAAVETVEASRAATLGAVDEAYAKLQSSWSERCLSAGISQLSPEQIAWSTWQALGVLEQQRAAAGAEWDAAHPADGATETAEQRATARAAFVEQKVYDNLHGSVATFVNLFGAAPGQPQQVFQATADQALFFANSGELRSWLAPGGGNLTERLVALTDDQAFAEELYLALFTRAPAAEEIDMVRTYLAGRQQDRAAAVQEIVWALVTSSEFRFGT